MNVSQASKIWLEYTPSPFKAQYRQGVPIFHCKV